MGGGSSSPPLWSLANIKCVAAIILRGPAVILCGMTSICSNLHDILHFQHQFFEIFLSVLGFSKGKYTFFQKCSKNGLVAKKMVITFGGGGAEPKGINIPFFFFFFFEPFPYLVDV